MSTDIHTCNIQYIQYLHVYVYAYVYLYVYVYIYIDTHKSINMHPHKHAATHMPEDSRRRLEDADPFLHLRWCCRSRLLLCLGLWV